MTSANRVADCCGMRTGCSHALAQRAARLPADLEWVGASAERACGYRKLRV
jgi:hypothetical protein